MAEDLSKLSAEALWEQITAEQKRAEVEYSKGIGVKHLIRSSNLITEMVSRIQYVEPDAEPEFWAFSFNDEHWDYENSNLPSKQEALKQAAGAAVEYDLDIDDAVYICRQMLVGDALVRSMSNGGILDGESFIYERVFEYLEVHGDCKVSSSDIADLDRRLQAAVRSWVRDKSPFGNWWISHPDQPNASFRWDGQKVVQTN